jgi:hypothetical protein
MPIWNTPGSGWPRRPAESARTRRRGEATGRPDRLRPPPCRRRGAGGPNFAERRACEPMPCLRSGTSDPCAAILPPSARSPPFAAPAHALSAAARRAAAPGLPPSRPRTLLCPAAPGHPPSRPRTRLRPAAPGHPPSRPGLFSAPPRPVFRRDAPGLFSAPPRPVIRHDAPGLFSAPPRPVILHHAPGLFSAPAARPLPSGAATDSHPDIRSMLKG